LVLLDQAALPQGQIAGLVALGSPLREQVAGSVGVADLPQEPVAALFGLDALRQEQIAGLVGVAAYWNHYSPRP